MLSVAAPDGVLLVDKAEGMTSHDSFVANFGLEKSAIAGPSIRSRPGCFC